ncbi:MAG: helix-turn-helix domain-containing protein, partial [Pseudohongiella sp.]
MVVVGISLYSAVLIVFELADERFRNAAVFGLTNAIVLLVMLTLGVSRLFRLRHDPARHSQTHARQDATTDPASAGMASLAELSAAPSIVPPLSSPVDTALAQTLDAFIARQGYHQNALTISSLARQLACPEHRLRRLINQTRGYRNFNSLLNDLRIDDAMARLADPAYDNRPILSIALDLGYDSIGPFNRAFKAKTAQTPGEFRRRVQNRR